MFFDELSKTKPRLVIKAVVMRACRNCGAAAVMEPICPNCGAKRPENEDRGVIFDSRWRNSWWGKIRNYINNLGR